MTIRGLALFLCCIVSGLAGCTKQQVALSGRGGADADLQTCLSLSEKKKFEAAIECLEIYKSRYRGSATADEAELSIGDNFFRKKEYLLAAESYEGFIKQHPVHPRLDYAYYRAGLAYLMEAPKAIDRDQEQLIEALKALDAQLQLFPESRYRAEAATQLAAARARLGRRHYYIGRFYYRTGEYRAAAPRLEEVLGRYTEIPEAARAGLLLARAHLAMGESAQAQEVARHMAQVFPDRPETARVQKLLAP